MKPDTGNYSKAYFACGQAVTDLGQRIRIKASSAAGLVAYAKWLFFSTPEEGRNKAFDSKYTYLEGNLDLLACEPASTQCQNASSGNCIWEKPRILLTDKDDYIRPSGACLSTLS